MLCHKINPSLELRLLQPPDAPALFALIDADRSRLREWLPWVDDTTKLSHTAKFVKKALAEGAETRAFTSGIWSEGQLVGVIRHNRIDWGNRISFPTYWLVSSAQGRGIMTQCCQAFYAHAFAQLGMTRIIVAVATENRRGQALALRLGFRQVSTLKKAEWLHDRWVDHLIYSRLSPDAPPGAV
jgi:ribosomal-protein-serine acetyltransferase